MTHGRFFHCFIFLFVSFQIIAQDVVKRIVPPTPNATALGVYGAVPVSLHTGIPNISIPLYQMSGTDIQLPIELTYHASGVKVEQMASWVGLGWALNAGGVVTREV